MELFLEWPNQKTMQKVGRKLKNFYSARNSMANIYVWLRIFKNKSLIGDSWL